MSEWVRLRLTIGAFAIGLGAVWLFLGTDAFIIATGLSLAVLAVPDIRTAFWIRGVQRQYPSVAIGIQKRYIDIIALAGFVFLLIGLNSAVALLLKDATGARTLLPMGAGIALLVFVALVLKEPGRNLRAQVRRLVAEAEKDPDPSLADDPRVPRA